MRMGLRQARALLILLMMPAMVRGAAAPAGPYAKQLAAECDALIQAGIRRPYGLGWDVVPPAAGARGNAPRHVTLEPIGTPAAGLLLLWSGQLLEEPRFRQAALDAARGVSTSLTSAGQVPLHVMFGTSVTGRDEPSPVPDRAATRAALTLMAEVLEANDPKPPELLSRSAQRAAQWLLKQQADDGGWPTGYSYKPEGETRPVTLRIIRLDSSDYRDNTFAILLAGQIMDDRQINRAAGKSLLKLINLRMGVPPIAPTTQDTKDDIPSTQPEVPPTEPLATVLLDSSDMDRRTNGLWSTAYRMSGALDENLTAFPAGADVIASRYAMQTILGGYLANGDRSHGLALDAASQALARLRDSDGTWKPYYRRTPTTAPATQEAADFFGPRAAAVRTADFGLPPVIDAVRQLRTIRRDRYLVILNQQFSLRQQLAATVCGLTDQPMTIDLPVTKSEVQTYLQGHAGQFAVLNSPIPENLEQRIRRLWVLLIRAKLEALADGA